MDIDGIKSASGPPINKFLERLTVRLLKDAGRWLVYCYEEGYKDGEKAKTED